MENFGSYMCFTFDIPDDIDYHDVDAAELWVYREPVPNANAAQSFLVSEIESWDSKKINKPLAIHYANSSGMHTILLSIIVFSLHVFPYRFEWLNHLCLGYYMYNMLFIPSHKIHSLLSLSSFNAAYGIPHI